VFDIALRLLHPIMPFITEALWQQLPHHAADASISVAAWPLDGDAAADPAAETEFSAVQTVVTAVRTLRAEYGVAPGREVHVTLADASDVTRRAAAAERDTIRRLARAATVDIGAAPTDASGSVVLEDRTMVVVPLGDLIDLDKECARLGGEVARLDERLAAQERKLANAQFVTRAAPAVVEKEREKLAAWRAQAEALRNKRRALGCPG
jgi:valyl-tRNA synthetase